METTESVYEFVLSEDQIGALRDICAIPLGLEKDRKQTALGKVLLVGLPNGDGRSSLLAVATDAYVLVVRRLELQGARWPAFRFTVDTTSLVGAIRETARVRKDAEKAGVPLPITLRVVNPTSEKPEIEIRPNRYTEAKFPGDRVEWPAPDGLFRSSDPGYPAWESVVMKHLDGKRVPINGASDDLREAAAVSKGAERFVVSWNPDVLATAAKALGVEKKGGLVFDMIGGLDPALVAREEDPEGTSSFGLVMPRRSEKVRTVGFIGAL